MGATCSNGCALPVTVKDEVHVPFDEKENTLTELEPPVQEFTSTKESETEELKLTESNRDPKRRLTYDIINSIDLDLEDDEGISPLKGRPEVQPFTEKEEWERHKKETLEKVENLVDVAYDILKAEVLLLQLEQEAQDRPEEWDEIAKSPLFTRFRRKKVYFSDVGKTVCEGLGNWFSAFEDSTGTQTIHGFIDPKDPSCLQYRVRAMIPASLTHAMAVANEVQFMPKWNNLIVGEPKVLGRRTAHYMVLNYQMSFVAGMYKVDVLSEIRRFTDIEGGFLAEYIESVPEGHPSYINPPSGFKRPKTKIKNVWIACGPQHTVLLQFGALNLPFNATKWLASTVGGLAGRFVIGGLVKNSSQASTPGNIWEEPLQSDRTGLYRRLTECQEARASDARSPAKGVSMKAEFDLAPFFRRPGCQRVPEEDPDPEPISGNV